MGKFVVTAPDGLKYTVTAPEGATQEDALKRIQGFYDRAAAITSSADLSIAQSNNDDFGQFLRTRAMAERPGESPEARERRLYGGLSTPDVGTAEGITRSFAQGSMFGGGDEVVAAGAAALNKVLGRDPGREYGELYDAYLGRERQKLGQFRKQSPVLATGSEIGGAIMSPVTAAMPISQAQTGLGRAVTGGAQGAGMGGAYGFLAGEGGPGGRATNAAVPAAAGGVLGAATPLAVEGATNLWSRTRGMDRAARQLGIGRPAMEELAQTIDPADYARARLPGPDAMVADVSPNTASLLDVAIQKVGPAGNRARQLIDRRLNTASRNLNRAFNRVLGQPRGVRGAARDIAQRTSTSRQAAYQRAYSSPIDYASDAGREIEGVLARIPARVGLRAIQEANDDMLAQGIRNQQIMAQEAADGAVNFVEMPNVQQLDYIKRALGRLAQDVDQFGRPSGDALRARSLGRELRNAVSAAVPEYQRAVRLGGDKIEMDNALALGRRMLRAQTTREEVREGIEGLSVDAQRELRNGIRGYIDDTLSNVRRTMMDPNTDAREAAKAVGDLTTRAAREKIRIALGDRSAGVINREIDRTARALGLKAAAVQNTKTFVRQSLDKRIGALTEEGPLEAIRRAEVVPAIKEIARGAMGRSAADRERLTNETFSDLVEVLAGRQGPAARQTAQQLSRVQQSIQPQQEAVRRLVEQLAKGGRSGTLPLAAQYDPITNSLRPPLGRR